MRGDVRNRDLIAIVQRYSTILIEKGYILQLCVLDIGEVYVIDARAKIWCGEVALSNDEVVGRLPYPDRNGSGAGDLPSLDDVWVIDGPITGRNTVGGGEVPIPSYVDRFMLGQLTLNILAGDDAHTGHEQERDYQGISNASLR